MSATKKTMQFYNHPNVQLLDEKLENGEKRIFLKGLAGSSSSLFCIDFFNHSKNPQLIVLNDKETAAYFYNDLRKFLKEGQVYFFPSSYKRSVQYQQPDPSNIVLRTEVLNLLSGLTRKIIIVTYPEALIEKVISRKELKNNTLQLISGEKVSMGFVEELLIEYQFQRTDFVYEPGQYSLRGSILDVFSYSNDHPYRIDFFGNEVESIRAFDVESQLSLEVCKKISLQPNLKDLADSINSNSIIKSLHNSFLIWTNDLSFSISKIDELYNNFQPESHDYESTHEITPEEKSHWLVTGKQIQEDILEFNLIEFGKTVLTSDYTTLSFNTSPQPAFNKKFELLASNLWENRDLGYTNYIMSENEKQIERLEAIFSDIMQDVYFTPVNTILHEGFVDHDLKICCYTDHQIFERYHKFQLRGNFSKRDTITLHELTGLHPGDYVVHIDHGVGRFGGLEKIEINGKLQETIKLVYKDNDTVYINIHALHRISKYKGKDSEPPKIHKLGSVAWKNLKLKAKNKIKDIARELIKLYAQRKTQKGFAFSADSYLQTELEASFIYEDTPDQLDATKAVKDSMEAPFPMDRLICGDVGFGKTEVAIRAAFKAVADSKQVAILVPTTILAFQHYNTFKARLKDFPCNIDYISRFKNPSKQKITLSHLSEGKIDIIIGTHRLTSKDVQFKNLGLFIIDEEQKFGVAVKEKIRQLKVNVDTLTLTATPIPRTLQFSLMGARDLSFIRTPPPNRHPIITELHRFNEQIIKEGIEYEISRGGQVFFIHNKIENIEEIKKLIDKLLPKIKSVIAHGRMEGRKLEAIMLDFIDGFYDVLISTTIIESGLDIPNANTIFINNAQNFGLSDLHQLRGRVGRSNKKAFCFLLAPPLQLVPSEARRRLKAIIEFSDLGSGLNIAMQDLDIRGAGNLLGSEQSGFITEIGYETYQKILEDAITELKESEFRDQFSEPESQQQAGTLESTSFVKDVYVDTDLELLFPDEYIDNISERIRLYRNLDNLDTGEQLEEFRKNLEDRFGPVPDVTIELMNVVRLRKDAKSLGFEKIVLKREQLILFFISNQDSPYYQSQTFAKLLNAIQKESSKYQMREKNGKLTLAVKEIKDLKGVLEIFKKLISSI